MKAKLTGSGEKSVLIGAAAAIVAAIITGLATLASSCGSETNNTNTINLGADPQETAAEGMSASPAGSPNATTSSSFTSPSGGTPESSGERRINPASPDLQPTFIAIPKLIRLGLPEGGETTNLGGCISGKNYVVADYIAFLSGPATVSSIRLQAWNGTPTKVRVGTTKENLSEYELTQDGNQDSGGYTFYKSSSPVRLNTLEGRIIIQVEGPSPFGVCILEIS